MNPQGLKHLNSGYQNRPINVTLLYGTVRAAE